MHGTKSKRKATNYNNALFTLRQEDRITKFSANVSPLRDENPWNKGSIVNLLAVMTIGFLKKPSP